MEFDESRVYTALNAEELNVGDKVDDSYSRFEIEHKESLSINTTIFILTDKETGKTFLLVRDCGNFGITQVR